MGVVVTNKISKSVIEFFPPEHWIGITKTANNSKKPKYNLNL